MRLQSLSIAAWLIAFVCCGEGAPIYGGSIVAVGEKINGANGRYISKKSSFRRDSPNGTKSKDGNVASILIIRYETTPQVGRSYNLVHGSYIPHTQATTMGAMEYVAGTLNTQGGGEKILSGKEVILDLTAFGLATGLGRTPDFSGDETYRPDGSSGIVAANKDSSTGGKDERRFVFELELDRSFTAGEIIDITDVPTAYSSDLKKMKIKTFWRE